MTKDMRTFSDDELQSILHAFPGDARIQSLVSGIIERDSKLGAYETLVTAFNKGATKPHHTHACQHCGHVWRPAIVNTVGVMFLQGFKNGDADGKA